jgi:hypothetical protein
VLLHLARKNKKERNSHKIRIFENVGQSPQEPVFEQEPKKDGRRVPGSDDDHVPRKVLATDALTAFSEIFSEDP